jgi:hypothetical protein
MTTLGVTTCEERQCMKNDNAKKMTTREEWQHKRSDNVKGAWKEQCKKSNTRKAMQEEREE